MKRKLSWLSNLGAKNYLIGLLVFQCLIFTPPVLAGGVIFLADVGAGVQMFDQDTGKYLGVFGETANGTNGNFVGRGVAVHPLTGNLFVVRGSPQDGIMEFDQKSGKFHSIFGQIGRIPL
ncbi:MAG: hypothetical protein ACE5EK_07115 [Nitrospinales bacterium]